MTNGDKHDRNHFLDLAMIAVFDIGSNSVRLVAYEGLTRSPTPIFNEKVLAGLGREVQTTGLLAPDAVEKALGALMRFRSGERVPIDHDDSLVPMYYGAHV